MPDQKRKQWLHSIGVCANCKTVDAYTMAGRWYCAECAEKERERLRDYRMEYGAKINENHRQYINEKVSSGLCRDCKKPTYNGTAFCQKHLYLRRQYQAKLRAKKREYSQGKCLWCDAQAVEDKKYCQNCLQRKREIIAHNRNAPGENHPWNLDTKIIMEARKTNGET